MAERDIISGAAPADREGVAVTLREVHLSHAWDMRGDATQTSFIAQARALFGLPPPIQPNTSVTNGDRALLRLGPRSWLFLGNSPAAEFENSREALNAVGGALFDVSASYVAWHISGRAAVRVLNRMCPLDLHSTVFAAGSCTQSLVGHVNAILYRVAEAPAFVLLVARSLAPHAWHHLCASAESERYLLAAPMRLGEVLTAPREGE